MIEIDRSKPVLVTGATGYIAGWLVKKLLDEGLTVHAAVRNPEQKEKLAHLDALANQSSGNIKYFKTDLLDQGSFAEAMDGCELVFHTASPFFLNVKNPQKELIEPALNGTKNVLEQANKTSSVKRVVLTSSCGAIYTDAIECEQSPNGELNEEIWNTTASLDYQPYSYSKTVAEQEAWKIAGAQQKWDLVVINPSAVLGPALNLKNNISESVGLLKQLGDGTLKQGVPDVGIGIVDVRDVADAHFRAGFTPKAKGRYITSAHNSSFTEMAEVLRKNYGEAYPIPKKIIPKWLLMLIGPMVNKVLTRKFIKNNVGRKWKANNSKIRKELQMNFRPLDETLNESFQNLIDNRIVLPKK